MKEGQGSTAAPAGRTRAVEIEATGIQDTLPYPRFDHLENLTGSHGLYEHALLDRPRANHGYTTDDNARALVILARAGRLDRASLYREFVLSARGPKGWRNRMSRYGRWLDQVGSADANGRAIWGLSLIATPEDDEVVSALISLQGFDTPHPRAASYAILGLSHLARYQPCIGEPARNLARLSKRLPRPQRQTWRWPEPKLTYANARLPQALISAGDALDLPGLIDDGLELLDWLIDVETGPSGFSFTPVEGRRPTDTAPGFDQQPIEAWAMADAALAASRVDRSSLWPRAVEDAALWFFAKNDSGIPLYDSISGAGYDGLENGGVNLNRGAESTLSALGALISAHELRSTLPANR